LFMATAVFQVDIQLFKRKALQWAQQFEEVCFFQSNGYADEYSQIDSLLAVQATACFTAFEGQVFQDLEKFRAKHPHCWMPGFLSYDLKTEIEELTTSSPNRLGFPEAYFFIPAVIISFRRDQVEIQGLQPETIYNSIFSTEFPTEPSLSSLNIEVRKRMSKEAYIEAFNQMIQHIQQGDIYEVNLCQEFYAE